MPEVTGRLRTPRIDSPPATPVAGEMYYDTALNKLFWWNGTTWIPASGSAEVYEQPGAPASPSVGAIWIDTDDVAPVYIGNAIVTSLPSNPADGQEVYYLADATNGMVWHLRYRAASASAYKWEFVGGPPLVHEIPNDDPTGSTTYVDLANVGPQIVLPLAGDYMASFGSLAYLNTGPGDINMSLKQGAAATSDAWATQCSFETARIGLQTHFKTVKVTGNAAGTALKCQYKVTNATGAWRNRWLTVTPVRVG
jgi:hypothetical protein